MIEVIKAEDMPNVGDYDISIYNAIIIPRGATNGDMIQAMFPNYTVQINYICKEVSVYYDGTEEYTGSWFRFDLDWWNAPYKRGNENGKN
jgi:hypothetical protein